jgi:VIT1/CCC1 family predicted Fe2+/Mn2+ transporter
MLKNNGDGSTGKTISGVLDMTGASKSVVVEAYHGVTTTTFKVMSMMAGDNDDSYGILVGSGSDPVSPTDYRLASKISHGTSMGQLDYETHSVVSSYSDTSSYVEFSRAFVNKTSSDIIVREVGIAAHSYSSVVGPVDTKYLIVRDVLPAPVKVKPLGSLTVRYRISLSM